MNTGLLFVTAPEADHKLVNRALLYLRDTEYGNYDTFRLMTSKNPRDRTIPMDDRVTDATMAPIDPGFENAWKGASVEDVEAYVVKLNEAGYQGITTNLFVVLDSEGIGSGTFVLGENQEHSFDGKEGGSSEKFNKARVPWEETYITWCCLDVGEGCWDEMMEEISGGADGWWKFRLPSDDHDLTEEDEALREAERDGDGRQADKVQIMRRAKILRARDADRNRAKRDAEIKRFEKEGKA
ncbi:hypothetical protein HYFRA_00012659 [Hymenoscyphus fraxineus]|uniref:Uncharacterized protein n=1 Tax=Hymenoscyphus fraxineus TaxID=746836 RepID=A0A9N9L9E0_9HELO|nr:hypothetical protein HYFRA_00012659 [Hymenoscyphus fraxineus]